MIETKADRSPNQGRLKGQKHYLPLCSVCEIKSEFGRYGIQIHHIDGKRQHNQLSNLIPICEKCHKAIHDDGLYQPRKMENLDVYNELLQKQRGSSVENWQTEHYVEGYEVYLPPEMIDEIDAQTDNRSEFIREALEEHL